MAMTYEAFRGQFVERMKLLLTTDPDFNGRNFDQEPELVDYLAKTFVGHILETNGYAPDFLRDIPKMNSYLKLQFARRFGPPGFDAHIKNEVEFYNAEKSHEGEKIDIARIRYQAYKYAFDRQTFNRINKPQALEAMQTRPQFLETYKHTNVTSIVEEIVRKEEQDVLLKFQFSQIDDEQILAVHASEAEIKQDKEDGVFQRNGELKEVDLGRHIAAGDAEFDKEKIEEQMKAEAAAMKGPDNMTSSQAAILGAMEHDPSKQPVVEAEQDNTVDPETPEANVPEPTDNDHDHADSHDPDESRPSTPSL